MGDFQKQALETVHKGEVRLAGGFRPNGGAAPTVFYGNFIKSAVRNGAGDITLTLKERFRSMRCISKSVSLQVAAAGDNKALLGPYNKTAGTQQVFTITGAAAADIAANADNIVWLELVLQKSNLNDGSPTYDE